MIEIKKATQCCICNKFMAKGTMCESIKQGKHKSIFMPHVMRHYPREVNNYG